MRTEPELLNERLDRLALVLDEIMPNCADLVRDALDLLKDQKTAHFYKCPNCGAWVSAENVVSCKDCKWRWTPGCFCKAKKDTQDNWFCSEGERV